MEEVDAPALKPQGRFADYLAIARFDHSTKHVFILPGMLLAYLLRGVHTAFLFEHIVLGLAAAICIASANYVINEWLDREFDKFHPTKSDRSAVRRELTRSFVMLEWIGFVALGLTFAYLANRITFALACLFALQGIVYNVAPLRLKDKPFLDVISESVNNPLRLMIGWAMIDPATLPPGSIILCYWAGGAFLMAAKRLSEYRQIVASHGKALLARYRASFAGYTDVSLTVSCLLYAMLSNFFLAIFLLKYRIEYLLMMPVVMTLFGHYLSISMHPDSSAQRPEKLFRERGLMAIVAALICIFALATFVDMPFLAALTQQQFISLP
ncbi:MAG: UbiA family prenyltransferase [Steroidobacteraceae bacterium]|jgi:4-hydroxybenzoate polyprenyltransferase